MIKPEKIFFKIGQHSFLIALAVMFSFPFIWMIAASGKVDREMFGEQRTLFPRAPKPVLISPHTDTSEFPEPSKPEDVRQEDYDRLKKSLSMIIYSAVLIPLLRGGPAGRGVLLPITR